MQIRFLFFCEQSNYIYALSGINVITLFTEKKKTDLLHLCHLVLKRCLLTLVCFVFVYMYMHSSVKLNVLFYYGTVH